MSVVDVCINYCNCCIFVEYFSFVYCFNISWIVNIVIDGVNNFIEVLLVNVFD